MTMTLTDMLTFVREHADADTADAPTTNLTVYARMAYTDILSRRFGWPHLKVDYTLTTIANQQAYAFTALSVTDLDYVSEVTDSTVLGRRLIQVSQADADVYWALSTVKTSSATGFVVSNETLKLYPTPSGVKSYTVRGFRKAAAWPTTVGSIPDLPASLHESICWYMLSSYFMSQEDVQMAGVYLQEYDKMVENHLRKETTKETRGRPKIMGGQNIPTYDFGRHVRGMLE